ncbi:MAG TPA: hypothetical protein VHX15_01565, partial [Frankiaceae bacterium]|nr:hypothetical protein [Frankiaceae bacterium]
SPAPASNSNWPEAVSAGVGECVGNPDGRVPAAAWLLLHAVAAAAHVSVAAQSQATLIHRTPEQT